MAKNTHKQMIDVMTMLPSIAPGDINFADGNKQKQTYLTGFEAGVSLVMQYWKKGEDLDTALINIDSIKEMMMSNRSRAKEDSRR